MTYTIQKKSRFIQCAVTAFTVALVSACMPAVYENPEHKYSITVAEKPHILELPVQGENLTPAQKRRISRIAQLHGMYGESPIAIASPQEQDTRLKVNQIITELNSHGVGMDQIITGSYVPQPQEIIAPDADAETDDVLVNKVTAQAISPIVVSFIKTTATTENCDDQWALDTTRSMNNNAQSKGFGCASQSNFATMLADPSDMIAPRPSTPVNAENKGRVLDAFIAGESTITPALDAEETQ